MSLSGYDRWKTTPDAVRCEFCGQIDCDQCLDKFEEIARMVRDPAVFSEFIHWEINDDGEKELKHLGTGFLHRTFSENFSEYQYSDRDFNYYCKQIGIEDDIIKEK